MHGHESSQIDIQYEWMSEWMNVLMCRLVRLYYKKTLVTIMSILLQFQFAWNFMADHVILVVIVVVLVVAELILFHQVLHVETFDVWGHNEIIITTLLLIVVTLSLAFGANRRKHIPNLRT